MQVPRPLAVGDAGIVQELRSVLFSEPILGATSVRPKGYMKGVVLTALLGWLGPIVARRATDPLPATILNLAVTAVDVRLFSKPVFGGVFEIGRWKKGTYRASLRESAPKLDLEVERLGRVTVIARSHGAKDVFDLIVQSAAGPAI